MAAALLTLEEQAELAAADFDRVAVTFLAVCKSLSFALKVEQTEEEGPKH